MHDTRQAGEWKPMWPAHWTWIARSSCHAWIMTSDTWHETCGWMKTCVTGSLNMNCARSSCHAWIMTSDTWKIEVHFSRVRIHFHDVFHQVHVQFIWHFCFEIPDASILFLTFCLFISERISMFIPWFTRDPRHQAFWYKGRHRACVPSRQGS
jgi:hypothetical protein